MKDNICYEIKSQSEFDTIKFLADRLGLSFCKNFANTGWGVFPYALIDFESLRDGDEIISGNQIEEGLVLKTIGEFINEMIRTSDILSVKISDDYNALWDKSNPDIVNVGCQKIRVSDIKLLIQKIEEKLK